MRFRRILLPGTTAAVVAAIVSALVGGPNIASAASTSLHTVLAQLHRNSKVSERLNAGFFRAPQTQGFVGSMFRPTDSDTAFSVNSTDHSLQLKPQRPGTTGTTDGTPDPTTQKQKVTIDPVDQTQGVFEAPIQIPNRAKVIKVQASYADSAGNNTTTNGTAATSGFKFEVLSVGLTGGSPTELLNNPAGLRSVDGRNSTDTLGLANNGFQVNNSTTRYLLRVTIDDTNANTKFYGFTIQYVIGKGVPGAPS
ncbi:MAG TPA: hypothetical protein VJU60_06485 [Thermoleophilaceae bacterium]|nr:hypothetical protein [Thermoleophilaceae bacterium]